MQERRRAAVGERAVGERHGRIGRLAAGLNRGRVVDQTGGDPPAVLHSAHEGIAEHPENPFAAQGRGVGAIPARPAGGAFESGIVKRERFDPEAGLGLAGGEKEA